MSGHIAVGGVTREAPACLATAEAIRTANVVIGVRRHLVPGRQIQEGSNVTVIMRLVIASALFVLTIVLLEKAVGKAAYEGFDVSPIVSILVLAIAAISASI